MAGFLKRLFGGGEGEAPARDETTDRAPDEEYKGVAIHAAPAQEGSQWRLAGTLTRTVDGEAITRRFMRADLVPSRDQAVAASLDKARLIIDQNGDSLWQGDLDRPV
ncbi:MULTISPECIES: HlyU family transcriptional regulator [unclassified Roseitalea]|uniref:HlyU family transcriptional regulator n=1 Tax=unclassified Roseitalea TaxID=2639107 RepID=UPI00273D2A30|nr:MULTISPECIES: HlyU family transcriptional regulator [unclassified Roseitalea]